MISFRVYMVAFLMLVNVPGSYTFTAKPLPTPSSTKMESIGSSRRCGASATTALNAKSGPMLCRPIGIGSAVPKTVITNVDLEKVVETSDEWIQTRTGIASRHVLTHDSDESVRTLAIQASQNALAMAQLKASDIDIVICCTSTPDDMFGAAPRIAAELGCDRQTLAFDLTAACSGFMFGMATAGQFLSNMKGPKGRCLVIGADALSRWVDWEDRNTCILFGDGAGAMILESSDEGGVLGYAAHSNGHGWCDLQLDYDGAPRKVSTPGDGTFVTEGHYGKVRMNGKEVYKFATREVPEVLIECMEQANLTVDDIDWLLLHQANIRIMEAVAKRLDMPMDKVIHNLEDYGNTSAASIPLALDEAVRQGKVKPGDIVACAGFGAGLSWGATIFKWG